MTDSKEFSTYWWTQTKSTLTAVFDAGESTSEEPAFTLDDDVFTLSLDGKTLYKGTFANPIAEDEIHCHMTKHLVIVSFKKDIVEEQTWDLLFADGVDEVKGTHHGLGLAQHFLGGHYDRGTAGLEKDLTIALELFQSGADLGNLDCQLRTAAIYHVGRKVFDVDTDHALSLKYHEMAAEQHNSCEGYFHCGSAHQNGQGTEKDCKKAIEYFSKAAAQAPELELTLPEKILKPKNFDQKDLNAQQAVLSMFNIGLIYNEGGPGVEADHKKALYWWKLASVYENPQSIFNLGVLHLNGQGVPQDPILAFFFFTRASSLSDGQLQIPSGFDALTQQLSVTAKDQGVPLPAFLNQMWVEMCVHIHAELAQELGFDVATPSLSSVTGDTPKTMPVPLPAADEDDDLSFGWTVAGWVAAAAVVGGLIYSALRK